MIHDSETAPLATVSPVQLSMTLLARTHFSQYKLLAIQIINSPCYLPCKEKVMYLLTFRKKLTLSGECVIK